MQQFRQINSSNPLGCLLTVLLLVTGLAILLVVFVINLILSIFGLKLPFEKWLMRMIFPGSGMHERNTQQGHANQGTGSWQDNNTQQTIEEPDESEYVDFKEVE